MTEKLLTGTLSLNTTKKFARFGLVIPQQLSQTLQGDYSKFSGIWNFRFLRYILTCYRQSQLQGKRLEFARLWYTLYQTSSSLKICKTVSLIEKAILKKFFVCCALWWVGRSTANQEFFMVSHLYSQQLDKQAFKLWYWTRDHFIIGSIF